MKQKNLVFFMTDQQRADTIGMSVNGVNVTPTLTKLSANATCFERAYNACPLCVPARTALATGVEPLKSGMFLNALGSKKAPNIPTIHKQLFDNGYDVAHVGVNHITVWPPLESTLPFAMWESDDTYAAYAKSKNLSIARDEREVTVVNELCNGEYIKRPYSNAFVSECQYATSEFKDVYFADRAVDFLKQAHEKPFALFIYLWSPHPPLRVPKEYLDMFEESKITLPKGALKEATGQPLSRKKGAAMQLAHGLDVAQLRKAWAAHCALTRLCDDQLAKVLDALNSTGQRDDTLVVFTTDHGEQLGEHKMYQKMEMYESAVRVPAIFKMPNAMPARLSTAISHLDFVPTILALLRLPCKPLDGVSLAHSVLTGTEPPQRDIFSVYCGNHQVGDCRRMIVRDKYKYVFDGVFEELYDLSEDQAELNNLAINPEQKPLCTQLYKALAQHFGATDYVKYREE